ncbi:MAG: hypothetical protein F7B61_00530, partial [Caldisphaeraceae archaeon]|nr:hypothetical protein [Caldisphaeraceae archaeon]
YYTKFYQSTSRNKDRTPKSKMRNDLQRFCKYLREHPGAKKEDIMRDLNIRNLNRFQYITRYLRRDDKIEVDKGYKYYLKEH